MIGGYAMNIPIRELKSELKNNIDECKQNYSYDNAIISKSIFGLFSKFINKFEHEKSYQTGLFIKSMDDWLDRKDNNRPLDKHIDEIFVGDIYMIDWCITYSPELSYEHPGIVMEIIDDFVFVLPVSGQKQYIEIGYHPETKTDGDKNYRIVNNSDGFKKECVIHINQAKTISKTRILYKIGSLTADENGNCELLHELKIELLNKYFQTEYNALLYENSELQRKNEYLSIQRKCNQSRADKFRNENQELKKRISELESIIDKTTNI